MKLGENFIMYLIAMAIGAALSLGVNKSSSARMHTLGETLFEPAYKKAVKAETTWYKTLSGWQLLVFLAVTLVVGFNMTKFSVVELLDEDGFAGAVRLFKGLFSPNFEILPKAVLNIIETIFMAFMATSLAIPIAFVLSFFCARNIMKGPVAYSIYMLLRTLLNFTRAIEALIWAIIFSVWVGIGPFAGMLALMIHSIASLAKQYSEMVETVSEGPVEGIQSTGATKLQTVWFAIVPQVILPYISFTVYRWDINVRMATIIGLVGGGGIGTMLIQ
jgi:phosphonate transport system permease protein